VHTNTSAAPGFKLADLGRLELTLTLAITYSHSRFIQWRVHTHPHARSPL